MANRPLRILLAGDHVSGLRDAILAQRPDLPLTMKPMADIVADDLNQANVYVGFRRPAAGWGKIRWIHSIGAGVDGLLRGEPLPADVLLTKSSEDFGPAIGEWCLTRALSVNQQLAVLAQDQAARRWGNDDRTPTLLRNQRVVVLGTGQVGRGIARSFRALGCHVVGLSRSGAPAEAFDSVQTAESFGSVIGGTHWLILAAPLTPLTRRFLSRDRMMACAGAYLMNVGRGALIDEGALPEALDNGWLRGAALDVFEQEPLPPDSPNGRHPRIVVSPHVSGPSTVEGTVAGFLESLNAVEAGTTPRLAIDPTRGY
ncbi:MAG: D-2-hydroxyacid dehydrogenase [Gemmatimonadales bacterium]